MNEVSSLGSNSAISLGGIGRNPSDYKVGESLTLVIHRHGGFQSFFDEMVLNPLDRLIEVEIKSVKAVKKQEFIDA